RVSIPISALPGSTRSASRPSIPPTFRRWTMSRTLAKCRRSAPPTPTDSWRWRRSRRSSERVLRGRAALRVGVEGEQLLRVGDAAQRVAPDRDEPAFDVSDLGKRGRYQHRLVERTAHRRDAAGLVDRRADDGEIQPLAASHVAVEDFAYMQAEIHVGHGLA